MSLLAAIAVLIIYGSLYPFEFSTAEPRALISLFSNWQLWTTPGDVLGNIGLFFPWGMVGMMVMVPRWGFTNAVATTALVGFFIALGAQILQIWVPSRDAALADVFWNLVGIFAGSVTGRLFATLSKTKSSRSQTAIVPITLLVGIFLAEWLPLVPSIDLQLIKTQLKFLVADPTLSAATFCQQFAMAVLAGHVIASLTGLRSSLIKLAVVLMMVSIGKFFIHGSVIGISSPLGLAAGAIFWWALVNFTQSQRSNSVWLTLLVGYTISAMAPFQLRDEPTTVVWLPFSALLEGSMLSNLQSLTIDMVICGGILYAGSASAKRYTLASIGLAMWLLFLELMQTMLMTRTADITGPLLVLFMGQALRVASENEYNASTFIQSHLRPVDASDESNTETRSMPTGASIKSKRTILSIAFPLVAAIFVITSSMVAVLQLPNMPYNVLDLFRENGSIPALLLFSIALLWAGGGAAWLGGKLILVKRPEFSLPALVVIVCLISFACLWTSVTTESLEDITGSTNVFWFVTQKDAWGTFWREVFLRLNAPDLVGFLERAVRYTALYAPLPIFLGVMIAIREFPIRGRSDIWRQIRMLTSAILILWLCKGIAFDWSSTDNLNELIARDGEWGWGGGGFLYALLLLICGNGLLIAYAISARFRKQLLVLVISFSGLPMGWWLLTHGLDQNVEKYGQVFSGEQFLLGPDRSHLLSTETLFFRWCLIQTGAVLLLAIGIRFGRSVWDFYSHSKPREL